MYLRGDQKVRRIGEFSKKVFNDLLLEEKKTNTPNISKRLKLNLHEAKKTKTETSYVTLFWLKDNAALDPFVREVMQICTTGYHPRPKCGRNIHINIKISPIQTYPPI